MGPIQHHRDQAIVEELMNKNLFFFSGLLCFLVCLQSVASANEPPVERS